MTQYITIITIISLIIDVFRGKQKDDKVNTTENTVENITLSINKTSQNGQR